MKFLISDLFKAIEKEEITQFFAGIPKTDSAIEIDCKDHSISDKPWELGDSVIQLMIAMDALPMNVKRVSFDVGKSRSSAAFYKMEFPINNFLSESKDLEFIDRFFRLELIVVDGDRRMQLFKPNKPSPQLQQNLRNILDHIEYNLLQVGLPQVINKITIDYITAGFSFFFKYQKKRQSKR